MNRCVFSVGDPSSKTPAKELPPLRMIERHYHNDTLLGSYDFTFSGRLALPSSSNVWEFEYEMPSLTPAQIEAIVADPFSLSSDSFYFLGPDLVLHHKAFYSFLTAQS